MSMNSHYRRDAAVQRVLRSGRHPATTADNGEAYRLRAEREAKARADVAASIAARAARIERELAEDLAEFKRLGLTCPFIERDDWRR